MAEFLMGMIPGLTAEAAETALERAGGDAARAVDMFFSGQIPMPDLRRQRAREHTLPCHAHGIHFVLVPFNLTG
jgi:hypothetical protein